MRTTSLAAWEEVNRTGVVSRMRKVVYNELYLHGPLTGTELDQRLASDGGRGHYHKRLSELREMGLVVEVGERPCSVSGKTAVAWDVTSNMPVGLTRAPKKSRAQLEHENVVLRAQVEKLKAMIRRAVPSTTGGVS